MVTVTPDSSGFNATRECLHLMQIASPYTSAQTVHCVIGNFHCFGFILECCYTQDGAEYLLREDTHLIVTLGYGRLDE